MSAVGLGVQHPGDIHSWQLPGEPWGPKIAKLPHMEMFKRVICKIYFQKLPPVCQWGCGTGQGLLGRALASSALRE